MNLYTMNGYEYILLSAIANEKITQAELAKFYAAAIVDIDSMHKIDWTKINTEIKIRWSPSGLTAVKEAAWKIVEADKKEIMQSMTSVGEHAKIKTTER